MTLTTGAASMAFSALLCLNFSDFAFASVEVYSANDLSTCDISVNNGQYGDCSGLGAVDIVAYHNGADPTVWNGQQIIDNLIVSRSYIGPPNASLSNAHPSAPQSLRLN